MKRSGSEDLLQSVVSSDSLSCVFNELPGMVPGKMQGNVAILKGLGFTATALHPTAINFTPRQSHTIKASKPVTIGVNARHDGSEHDQISKIRLSDL